MKGKQSFNKIENEMIHHYRKQLNHAESVEDVKKFFNYAITDLIRKVFNGKIDQNLENIRFNSNKAPFYTIHDELFNDETFAAVWSNSDLSAIIGRFAESSEHRYRHLSDHPEKTRLKIKNH